MKVDLGIWDKLARLIILLLVMATFIGIVLWYKPLFKENERNRINMLENEKRIREELETSNRLKAQIDSFRNPRTVERIAREKLHYARSNETVIRFDAPPPETNPAPAQLR
jgi:cell division protein FtsB